MHIRSLANFVGIGRVPPDMGVGFLNVSIIRLRSAVTEPVEVPPRYPLNATWYEIIPDQEKPPFEAALRMVYRKVFDLLLNFRCGIFTFR